MSLEYIL